MLNYSATAAQRWSDELAGWRISPEILAAAADSPYGFPVGLFGARPGNPPEIPTTRLAREAVLTGGRVLDVGCGGGAASLPLAPPAAEVVGVDESAAMLSELEDAAAARGVRVGTVRGSWPDVAADCPVADVVVCAHVAYNVPDLASFALALDAHARCRVVMELTAVHPWVPLGPLWRRVHGEDRPSGPTADLAARVLADAGLPVRAERFHRPPRDDIPPEVLVEFARRRLCLPTDRWQEIGPTDLVGVGVDDIVTLWWDTAE